MQLKRRGHTLAVGFPQLRQREELLWAVPTRSRVLRLPASPAPVSVSGSTPIDTRFAPVPAHTRVGGTPAIGIFFDVFISQHCDLRPHVHDTSRGHPREVNPSASRVVMNSS